MHPATMYRTIVSRCSRQRAPALQAAARRMYSAASSAAPPFDWQDPLNAKNLLTEEELAISETAEKYCQEQLLPRVLGPLSTLPRLAPAPVPKHKSTAC